MLEQIIWQETGIGQPAAIACGIVSRGVSVAVVAPKAIHSYWMEELNRAGVKDVSLLTPYAAHKNGVGAVSLIVVDAIDPHSLLSLAPAIQNEPRPIWLRVDRHSFSKVNLLPDPALCGDTAAEIRKKLDTGVSVFGTWPSYTDAAKALAPQYPAVALWISDLNARLEFVEQTPVSASKIAEIVAASDKPQVVFYRKFEDVEHIPGERMMGSDMRIGSGPTLLDRFGSGEVKTLLVPCGLVTGWRSPFPADEMDVHFVGEGWRMSELQQGFARAALSDRTFRPGQGSH